MRNTLLARIETGARVVWLYVTVATLVVVVGVLFCSAEDKKVWLETSQREG